MIICKVCKVCDYRKYVSYQLIWCLESRVSFYWSQFLNSIGFLSRQHLVHACLKMSKPFFRIFTARLPHTCAIFSPVCDSTQIFRFLNFWTFFGTIRISTAKLSHTCARVSLVCDASFFKISIVLESLDFLFRIIRFFYLESLDFLQF